LRSASSRLTTAVTTTQQSSSNPIPINYAAMPEYQVFFGSPSQPHPYYATKGISARIVGGSDANFMSYFTMQLTQNVTTQSWHFAGCSATLISNCHVLTAGEFCTCWLCI
jgi:hypothetical protein